MPFCSQCGNSVREADAFCTKCGARQPIVTPGAFQGASEAISDKTACVLCYVPLVGWIASILVLATQRFRENRVARFHAFQGLYLFVAWLLADRVLSPILHLVFIVPFRNMSDWNMPFFGVHGLLQLFELVILGVGVYMMFRVSENQIDRLPVLGDLAEKSL